MTTAMARARLTDGIEVIFDQDSRSSFQEDTTRSSVAGRSRSRSSGSGGVKPRSSRRAAHHRRHHRSSSSSSSSASNIDSSSRVDRPRSRSHPRCHRPSERCRCDDHYSSRHSRRHGGGHRRRSPPRHYRARSRSYSPSTDRSARRRSDSQKRHHHHSSSNSRRLVVVKTSPSPSRSSRSGSRSSGHSGSRSSGHSVSLSVDAKRELLRSESANAVKNLVVETLELPERVRPTQEHRDSRSSTPEPEREERVRPEPVHERTRSQSTDESDEDDISPRMSPKRRIITFSIHNSVAKPTVAPNCPKVTSRMDIVGSRKPYGQWVKAGTTGKISVARTHYVKIV